MAKEEKRFLKYFELPIEEAKKWDYIDWFLFVVESLYTTVFPFIAGVLLAKKEQLIWILFLILPIYFRMKVLKSTENKRRKRIYVH